MLNDRDEQHKEPEESEYHFSDDDFNYEVDEETAKPLPKKASLFERASRSKRMLISAVVFLALVAIVYKVVVPTQSTAPATDITAVVEAAPPMKETVSPPAVIPVQPPAVKMINTAKQNMVAPPSIQQGEPPVIGPAAQQPMVAPISAPSAPQSTVAVVSPSPSIPVQTLAPVTAAVQQLPGVPDVPIQQGVLVQPGTATAQQPAEQGLEMQKAAGQMQLDYTQKISDVSSQNKALQEEMQTLNTRVASIETQMGQLIQALSQAEQESPSPAVSHTTPKVPYSVQAIIPGRAWLRSDNGETVTVAEGDVIRNLGRVIKINPYDGVVEISSGNRTISLTYGNGS